MTKIPKWMSDQIRSKTTLRTCEANSCIAVPYIRAFRFLISRHGFRITRVERTGRQLAIGFRQRQHRLTLVDENGRPFEIYYELMKTERSPEPVNIVNVDEIISKDSARPIELRHCKTLKQELENWSTLLQGRWDEIFSDIEVAIAKQNRSLSRLKKKIENFLSSDPALATLIYDVDLPAKICSFAGNLPSMKSYNSLDGFAEFPSWTVLFDVTVQGKPQD